MEDTQSKLLAHYRLDSLYPSEWPADRNEDSDASETETPKSKSAQRAQRAKSRYSVLERGSNRRTSIIGTQKGTDGVENLVQRDEADPLGTSSSVVQMLRSRGLPVEEDMKLRNRFLLSSTTFSPSLFLSQVHSSASTDSLLQGLDFLSRSIEKKSASLKVLVESNFERFVRAKATIDNVYREMRNHGAEEDSVMLSAPDGSRKHSRQFSRGGGSGHYRKLSTTVRPLTPNASKDGVNKPLPSDKKKNALTKESEYGVAGIKGPLVEVAVKAEEVWGPALGGREREETLKAVLSTIEQHRELFELGTTLQDAIRRKDNELIVEEFKKARRFADDAKDIADGALQRHTALTDAQVYQILVTARVWTDVRLQAEKLKSSLWSRLAGIHFTKHASAEEDKREEHMELINILLELGVDDNPFEAWLISRYYYLKNRIQNTADRSKIEIEILRRRIDQGDKPTLKQISTYLRSPADHRGAPSPSSLDSAKVIEFWEHLLVSINALLSLKGGLLGEVIEFWETAQSIISGAASSNLPNGPNGQSKQHHRLTPDAIGAVYEGAAELESLLRESASKIFLEAPPEDISLLMSPIPPTPDTPRTPRTPKSALLSPFVDSKFKFDPSDIPPPSPSRGEAWEGYAFWPPYANCLSGVHYLSKLLVIIGTAAAELTSLKIPQQGSNRPNEESRRIVNRIRERCASAVCAAWDKDADLAVRVFEDWTRSPEKREITNLPARFMAFETVVVNGLQKILYIDEAAGKASDIILPPSSSLVQMVKNQFNVSLYKLISGIDQLVKKGGSITEIGDVTVPAKKDDEGGLINSIDASTESVRVLLALSNLGHLRSVVIIQLRQTMESQFSITLADDMKKLNGDLSTLDSKLFNQYITPHSSFLSQLINQGIQAPDWEPPTARPADARPYVYSVLLRCVLIHTELLTYTPPLTVPILRHLLEKISSFLISAFETRTRFSLPALMQATLDTEFLAQTLGQYTTDKASETQSKIYVVLDERTGQAERVRLQEELQEMRSVLKRLREATKGEFSCFKRARGTRPGSRGRE